MKVRKRDGRIEEFSKAKIVRTCLRAGASKRVAEKVADEVERRIYDGISTDEVLELVIEFLLKHEYAKAARYDLKRSLLRLGPTGFGFEKFVARLLEEYGYRTETNVVVGGRCVNQEIDVVAENERGRYMVECKFHNVPIYTGLKETMYTYARFLDVKDVGGFVNCLLFTSKFKIFAEFEQYCMLYNNLCESKKHILSILLSPYRFHYNFPSNNLVYTVNNPTQILDNPLYFVIIQIIAKNRYLYGLGGLIYLRKMDVDTINIFDFAQSQSKNSRLRLMWL